MLARRLLCLVALDHRTGLHPTSLSLVQSLCACVCVCAAPGARHAHPLAGGRPCALATTTTAAMPDQLSVPNAGSTLKSKSKAGSSSKLGGGLGSKSQLRSKSRARLRAGSKGRIGDDGEGDGEELLQAKEIVKPANQLELDEAQLKEEFSRMLRGENPNAPDNVVQFSYKEQEYKQVCAACARVGMRVCGA